nr:hypothetical protein [Escherichia coli O25b:H4-ST131]
MDIAVITDSRAETVSPVILDKDCRTVRQQLRHVAGKGPSGRPHILIAHFHL